MDSKIRLESDIISYRDTKPNAIISQLKCCIKNVEKSSQKGLLLNQLESKRLIFTRAQERWEEAQKDVSSQLNILEWRQNEEIYRLKIKIRRYQILDKYGIDVWVNAYQLAQKYQDIPDKLESGDIQHQIAKDLLDNKLGYWFSDDMDEWENIIFDRSQ